MRGHYLNKYLLGELTLEDLINLVRIEGDFTIGRNWLPIVSYRISRRKKTLQIFMDSLEGEPEMEIPIGLKVRIEGRVASMRIESLGYPRRTDVRIRFDEDIVFP